MTSRDTVVPFLGSDLSGTIDKDRLMRVGAAAQYLEMSSSSLNKMRCYGSGPTFLRLGRSIRYSRRDLDEWLQARRTDSTIDGDNRLPRRLADRLATPASRRRAAPLKKAA